MLESSCQTSTMVTGLTQRRNQDSRDRTVRRAFTPGAGVGSWTFLVAARALMGLTLPS